MKEKAVTINQCQDCGCPGSQIMVDISPVHRGMGKSPEYSLVCPYCKRRAPALKVFGAVPSDTIITLLIKGWNSINREYKEGLA